MTNIGLQKEVEDALASYSTPFKTLTVADQNVQFSIDPQRGLTERRYQWFSDGNRYDETNFTETPEGIRLSTNGTTTSEARIHSAVTGQYISQTLAVPGMGLFIPDQYTETDENNLSSLTNGEVYAGAFWWDEGNNQVDTGIGFKWDTSGWYFFVKSNGNHLGDSPVPQTDFNIDKFNTDGPSGQVHNPPFGYVYNWPFTWYNEGPFEAGYLSKVQNQVEEAHRLSVEGPSIETPNLPLQLVVRNAGSTSSIEAELGGMQYTTYGAGFDDIEFRETDESRITEGQSYLDLAKVTTNNAVDPVAEPGRPLISIRRKDNARDVAVSIQQISTRPINDDIYVFQWDEFSPSTALTGASFTDPSSVSSSRDSKILTDTQATAYSPSSDSVLRAMRFFEGGAKNDTGSQVTKRVDARTPIGATRVITAVYDGDVIADVDPFFIKTEESY